MARQAARKSGSNVRLTERLRTSDTVEGMTIIDNEKGIA